MAAQLDFAGMVSNEVNPDLFVGLPFTLPNTTEASEWLNELDFVDAQTGDLNELRDLAERAPTDEASCWLQSMISVRAYQEMFQVS